LRFEGVDRNNVNMNETKNKTFDSFADKGKVVIVTMEYSELHCGNIQVEHYISISRAKEIYDQLGRTINKAAQP